MLGRREGAYETSNEPDTLDALTRRLAADLRKHVRMLDSHELFSKEWLNMVDSLVHISNIALMEHRLPRSEGDSTLWEGDELTVRFLLEEGKLNLCLRLMHLYSSAVAAQAPGTRTYAQWLAKTAQDCGLPDAETLQSRLLTFEQCLGSLIRCALEHVEAVQTCDLQELMEHAAEVLTAAAAQPEGTLEFDRTQATLVLRYLNSVFGRIEQLGEDRIMQYVEKHSLVRALMPITAVQRVAPTFVPAPHLHRFISSVAICTSTTRNLRATGSCQALPFLPLHLTRKHSKLIARHAALHSLVLSPPLCTSVALPRCHVTQQFVHADTQVLLKSFKVSFLSALASDSEQRKRFRPLLDVVERGY